MMKLSILGLTLGLVAVSDSFADARSYYEDVKDNRVIGCGIEELESGTEQLYIRGQFVGNFKVHDRPELFSKIAASIASGRCHYPQAALPAQSPHLTIADAMAGRISHCEVAAVKDRDGTELYQLKFRGKFSGNFRTYEKHALAQKIIERLRNVSCRYL